MDIEQNVYVQWLTREKKVIIHLSTGEEQVRFSMPVNKKLFYYGLGPYFGGNAPAPHNMRYTLKHVSF